jgi:hypothetical protein
MFRLLLTRIWADRARSSDLDRKTEHYKGASLSPLIFVFPGLGDVGSGTIYKYRLIFGGSTEFAKQFTAEVVTPRKRATSAPQGFR